MLISKVILHIVPAHSKVFVNIAYPPVWVRWVDQPRKLLFWLKGQPTVLQNIEIWSMVERITPRYIICNQTLTVSDRECLWTIIIFFSWITVPMAHNFSMESDTLTTSSDFLNSSRIVFKSLVLIITVPPTSPSEWGKYLSMLSTPRCRSCRV